LVGGVLMMRTTKNYKMGIICKAIVGMSMILFLTDGVNAEDSSIGIVNSISSPYTNSHILLNHIQGTKEGVDFVGDGKYYPMFNPEGIASKTISGVNDPTYGYLELDRDSRPVESKSIYNCELSLISEDGSPIDTTNWNSKENPLSIYHNFGGGAPGTFEDDTLTLQITQMVGDPNMVGNVYDLRKEIHYGSGTGIIPLPDLNGVYNSEEVYGKFSVYFDRNLADFNNDRIINLQDFSLLAQEWGKVGNSLADIAISEGNAGIVLPGTTTPYFDGVVDIADIMYFADNWLVEY
jgi:hypothetical protein